MFVYSVCRLKLAVNIRGQSNSTTSHTPNPQGTCYPERATKIGIGKKVEENILAPVSEATDWVSRMITVVKPNKLRNCINLKHLNRAIKRPHYPLPTVEEDAASLSKAKVFSVLDAKSGFWQVLLDEASSRLTTFNTPFGQYRWLCMPFGISSAPKEFQKRMNDTLVWRSQRHWSDC